MYEVAIIDGYKSYGRKKSRVDVMRNMDMAVPRGYIYALLGASGSGKTTILHCVVGLRRLDKGLVFVLGGPPGSPLSGVPGRRIGFMPQELGLNSEFTVIETLTYFALIYNMSRKDFMIRLNELRSLLQLPHNQRSIKNLSGGQKRRVSLAVAVLQFPQLLVLDEPTVGIDPLVRKSIWLHLRELVKTGKVTVLMTTHYIEEALQADRIGMLRDGKLLTEDNPRVLLEKFQTTKLESVFLELSKSAERGQPGTSALAENKLSLTSLDFDTQLSWGRFCRKSFCFTSWGKSKALLMNNIMQLARNPGTLVFVFLMPVIQLALFCLGIGHPPRGLTLGVINGEYPDPNTCPVFEGCSINLLSCRYINALKKSDVVQLKQFDSEDEAIAAVKRGESWGVIKFDKQFSSSLFARFMTTGRPEILDKSTIYIRLDMANQQIGFLLIETLYKALEQSVTDLIKDCPRFTNGGNNVSALPIEFGDAYYGEDYASFFESAAPGISLVIVFFLSVGLSSLNMIVDRKQGLMQRSYVAGVTRIEILMSHVIVQMVLNCVQSTLILILVTSIFGITCRGSFTLALGLIVLQGFCGMCFGFLISAVCNDVVSAVQFGVGLFYPIILLSGVIWPLEGMPQSFSRFAQMLPLTHAVIANRAIFIRGWDLSYPCVSAGFTSVSAWALSFLFLTSLFMFFRKK